MLNRKKGKQYRSKLAVIPVMVGGEDKLEIGPM